MKKWLIAIVLGSLLALGACGSDDDSDSNTPEDNGDETVDASGAEDIFKNNCATCHGDDLSGENGTDLTEVGSKMSKDEIEQQIEDGGNGMPGGLVSGDDADTLSQWLSEKK